jgi:hypothetical protein
LSRKDQCVTNFLTNEAGFYRFYTSQNTTSFVK